MPSRAAWSEALPILTALADSNTSFSHSSGYSEPFKSLRGCSFKTPAYIQNNSPNSVIAGSIAPRTTLGRSNLIHLCNSLFEFFILAFLVRMSLILSIRLAGTRQGGSMPYIPRISKAGSILQSGSD